MISTYGFFYNNIRFDPNIFSIQSVFPPDITLLKRPPKKYIINEIIARITVKILMPQNPTTLVINIPPARPPKVSPKYIAAFEIDDTVLLAVLVVSRKVVKSIIYVQFADRTDYKSGSLLYNLQKEREE